MQQTIAQQIEEEHMVEIFEASVKVLRDTEALPVLSGIFFITSTVIILF